MNLSIFKKNRLFFLIAIPYTLYSFILIIRSSFVIEGVRYFTLFDDMMISMRYAKHLAQGYGLVWNIDGPRVEGFSNLLWTLYMSLLHLLPHSSQTISLYVQLSALLIMVCNLYFVWKILKFFTNKKLLIFFGLFFTSFYFPLNNWSLVLGTEVGILTLLLTIVAYLILTSVKKQKANILIYPILGIATLVRMDAIVPSILTVLILFIYIKRGRWSSLIIGTIVISLFVLLQEAFRLIYYKEPLPNTYYLKLNGYSIFWRIMKGIYVLPGVMNWLLLIPIVLYLYFIKNRYLLILFAFFCVQVIYSVYVGGDAWETMGGSNRYITVVMPLFFSLFIIGYGNIFYYIMKVFKKIDKKRGSLVFIVFLLISYLSFSMKSDNMLTQTIQFTPPATKFENSNQVKMAMEIEKTTNSEAVVGIVWAGIVPYFTERRYIDLLGKNDLYIARQKAKLLYAPPRFFEHVRLIWPGHNKWDYEYALKQKPDMFAQIFPSSEEEKILKAGYEKVTVNFDFYINKNSSHLKLKSIENK